MQARLVTIAAPCKIECAATPDKGPPKFSAIAYSGGLIPGYTAKPALKHPYALDLAKMSSSKKIIANLDHEQGQRVGHVTNVANDKRQIVLAGLLSAATSYRDEVAGSAKDGFEWEVSIEAELSNVAFVRAGETRAVNGQTFAGPIYVVQQSTLTGLAFVSQGADAGNSVSIAATTRNRAMSTENEITDPLIQGETERLAEIEAVCRGKWHKSADRVAELKQQAINGEIDFNELRSGVLQALRDQMHKPGDFTQGVSRESVAGNLQVMECALARTAGMINREKFYSEEILEAADRSFKSFGLQQLLLTAACSNGYDGRPGERLTDGNLRRVLKFAFRDDDYRGTAQLGNFSSISVPNILGNVANKEILTGYMEEDQAWREISVIKPVSDFKQATSYRMTDSVEYEQVPKGGEIKHGSLGEESYTRQAKTYAKMLGLDRVDIVNDDLGAFDDLRRVIGRGGAKKLNTVYWTAFMGSTATLFPTNNSKTNYLSGATTNLGIDGVGLELGVSHFLKMTSADSKRLGGQPVVVLVPPELFFIARRFFVSPNVTLGGGSATTSVPTGNIFEGLYRPVSVSQLSDTSYTGYSTTAWYLFRDKNILAPMCVSFLNGQQTPTVESTDADFDQLGIMFRGYFDFGCDIAEYGAGVKIKGAA